MSAYYYLAKMKILISLTYRFEVFTTIGTNFILMVAGTFLWKAAYKGIDTVAGVNESQMIAYSIISIMLASFFSNNVEYTLNYRIRQGEIAIDFFRPVNLLFCYLAEDIGQSISSAANKLLPMIVIAALFIHIPAPAGIAVALVFIASIIMSFMILWLISATIGLLSFWAMELGNIGAVKDGIIVLLSGKIIPLWLFPKGIQKIMAFLPFQSIYQTPLSIYIGKLPLEQAIAALIIQLLWVAVLTLLLCSTWSKARKCVMIQGG